MGRFLGAVVLLLGLLAAPAWASGRFQKNVFGGWDYYEQGRRVFSMRPNVFGGWDIYRQGRRVGSTRPNVFGGQDVYLGSRRVASTRRNVFGGQDVHRRGRRSASTRPNVFGGRDVYRQGRRVGSTRRGTGNSWRYHPSSRTRSRRHPRADLLSDRELVHRLVVLFGE